MIGSSAGSRPCCRIQPQFRPDCSPARRPFSSRTARTPAFARYQPAITPDDAAADHHDVGLARRRPGKARRCRKVDRNAALHRALLSSPRPPYLGDSAASRVAGGAPRPAPYCGHALFSSRPRPGHRGAKPGRRPRRDRPHRPGRRGRRLPPLLACRAPQHARHRLGRDGGRDRPRRRPDQDDPGRRRRHHAAQPRAAGGRRAVRHAGRPLSRADRPRARPRARHRRADDAGAAPPWRDRRSLPRGRDRADRLSRGQRGRGAGARDRGAGAAGGDPRLVDVRGPARGLSRPALCLCQPLCPGDADRRARDLPADLPSLDPSRRARTR